MDYLNLFVYIISGAMIIWAAVATWSGYKKEHIDVTQDPYYKTAGIKKDELILYQHFINRLVMLRTIATATKTEDISPTDHEKSVEIIEEAASEGLNEAALTVMLHQWVYADTQDRLLHQKDWVLRVLHRANVDCFPSSLSIIRALTK